jgi:hypothetical protein
MSSFFGDFQNKYAIDESPADVVVSGYFTGSNFGV